MIFEEKDKRTGKTHVVCSKYWPDGVRFRRRCPTKTVAGQLLARIEAAIVTGIWRQLRKELTEKPQKVYTIKEFADVYLEEYCRVHNTRPDFKEETLQVITRIVGHIPVTEFTRKDAMYFETVRSKEVAPATVNRGLAVLSNMLRFALDKQLITFHPMERYSRLRVDQKERRCMTLEEERRLVACTMIVDAVVGGYVGILGETAMRMEEGLNLQWEHVDITNRLLTVAASKNGKVRHVALSDFALELLRNQPRVINSPFVFVRLSTMERLRAPRKEFEAGRRAAQLEWVRGLHDLRHFRATQWIKEGIDPFTVKNLLGHSDINTTMVYSHYDPHHALKRVLELQNKEGMYLERAAEA